MSPFNQSLVLSEPLAEDALTGPFAGNANGRI